MEHFLCGTCVGEHERHAGVFESGTARESVGAIDRSGADLPEGEVFCCACGQRSYAAASFRQRPGSDRPCDGVHETPGADD